MLKTGLIALSFVLALPASAALDWKAALSGEHRSDANAARDQYRHPRETLEFFGLKEGMNVVELSPGGGWYTEVLAPLMAGKGRSFAAHGSVNGGAYARRALGAYLGKLGEKDDVYGQVIVTELSPPTYLTIAPAGSADLVLAFRNIHSWIRAGSLEAVLGAAFTALRPGGVFGVVQHRGRDGISVDEMKNTGYVTEAFVIAAAEAAGFELAERSEINANPKDPADHERGVWTLPPSLTLGDTDRARYLEIGESDRMTLKFLKPGA
jgi:predicted methyltransferase